MNKLICICGLLFAGVLSCQAQSSKTSGSEPDTATGRHPSSIKAHPRTGPASGHNHRRSLWGVASWYGRHFEGKKTASGETFHADGHTVASKTIPLGSTVKVTNLKNGQSADAKVTDRGPYVPGRVVDVSKGTAQQLGMTEKGVTPVKVTVVKPPPEKTPAAAPASGQSAEGAAETKPEEEAPR